MDENKFKCDICKKYYKSYQSLWHHKKRYHDQKPTNYQHLPTMLPTIDPHLPTNNTSIKMKKSEQTICNYCDKTFSCYNSMNRHQQTCKCKKQEKETEELKKELIELKKMVAELIKNKSNITNTNTNNNSNNTTNNNNNNGTINNNYITIVPFTKENFVEVSTEEEHLLILKQKGHNAIYKCIELKHFNEKYPQFHNFMIPNKRTNDALVYDENIKDFKLDKKETAIDEVITYAEFDIEDIYALHENKMNDKVKKNIEKLITDTSPNPKHVEDHVESMGYDYRNMIKNTYKKTRKQQQSLQ